MGSKTKINWTDSTWNPISGCSKLSNGCQNCYAEAMARRFEKDWQPWTAANAEHNVQLYPGRLDVPLHWRKPRKVFVCSTSDLFHEEVPDKFIAEVFQRITDAPQHIYQILTKRPARMLQWFKWPRGKRVRPHPNVWLGVTAENQSAADVRIPLLLQTPAAVRFVSCEPLLGPVSFRWMSAWPDNAPTTGMSPSGRTNHLDGLRKIDWVIVGGESGPSARPMKTGWARSVRDQCQTAGVPFFFKGWGKYCAGDQLPDKLWAQPDAMGNIAGTSSQLFGVGKKAAGRELDGREWNEAPG